MDEIVAAAVDWNALRDRSVEVPFAALRREIERVKGHPELLEELYARWEEVENAEGAIETYERIYIPYILRHVAEGLPEKQRTEVYEMLLAYLTEAGLVDDEGQCEFLLYTCQDIGPPILPALLDILESEDFSPATGDWFYHWGVAEVAVRAEGELRKRVGDAAIKAIADRMEDAQALGSTPMAADLLALLGRTDAIETLVKAEARLREEGDAERVSADEMKYAVRALRGGEREKDRPGVDLDKVLREEVGRYDEWYRTRGADWNAPGAGDEGEMRAGAVEELERKLKALLEATGVTPADSEEAGGMGNLREYEEYVEPIRAGQKVGRNEPCPCGSGIKYKKCCGK